MKVVKPQKLGVLTKTFEHDHQIHFSVAVLAFFPFDAPDRLLGEVALWKFLPKELGRDAAIDVGMPKARGELLLFAKAFPRGAHGHSACTVRAKLGAVDKRLLVVGDRHWTRGSVSEPAVFTEMPITYERAFGGPGYPANPVGKGFASTRTSDSELHPLPNIEDPKHPVKSPGDRPAPAGFGPYDLTWPQRFAKIGTYDTTWLKEQFPGFAHDIDWTMFNSAPDDQQFGTYLTGGESFVLENLHPTHDKLEGNLPTLRARTFVTQKTPEGETFREIPMRLETVYLFPHAEKGVVLYRGVTRVAEDDGADVLHLVVAGDAPASPRPIEHYRNVLSQRLDRARGHLFALRDVDLVPVVDSDATVLVEETSVDDALIRRERLLEKNVRRRAAAELARTRESLRERGLDPDRYAPAELPPEPPPAYPETLDVQVTQAESLLAEQQKVAETQRTEAEEKARAMCEQFGLDYDQLVAKRKREAGGPPRFSAEAEMARLQTLLQSARAAGIPTAALEARLADPTLVAKLTEAERSMRETYRVTAHLQPAAATRDRASSKRLRAELEAMLAEKKSLAGIDLTGVDLTGIVLAGADLHGAFLERTKLADADLHGADLTGAVLARADLRRANLAGAKLANANLGGAVLLDATLTDGADLTHAILNKADLTRARLTGAVLSGADLGETTLTDTDLERVDARGLTFLRSALGRVRFAGADLRSCNFLEVDLTGADFSGVRLEGAVLLAVKATGANFRGANMDNLRVVHHSALVECDFQEARLERANFRGSDLHGAKFSKSVLDGADLSECNLTGAQFYRARAREARFVRADLTEAMMVSIDLLSAILQKATLQRADLTGANLFRADMARVRGRPASLEGANLKQVRVIQWDAHG